MCRGRSDEDAVSSVPHASKSFDSFQADKAARSEQSGAHLDKQIGAACVEHSPGLAAKQVPKLIQVPGDIDLRHGPSLCLRETAAVSTASIIFWYPVHLHKFPERPSRISDRVGLGLRPRRSIAAKII